MKSLTPKIRFLHRNPPLNFFSTATNSSGPAAALTATNSSGAASALTATNSSGAAAALTADEVNQINAIIPRLCAANHLKEATNLISAALSTPNPPLTSLSLSSFIATLALQPDITLPMHLLNVLKHNPNTANPHFIMPVVKMLVSSFLWENCPRRAVKVFQWVSRPDFPGGVAVDLGFYADLIEGFCRNCMVLDSLHVLRVMASGNLAIGSEVKMLIYRGFLREARVREAIELNAALERCTPGSDGGTFGSKEVVDLLDQMIATWVD